MKKIIILICCFMMVLSISTVGVSASNYDISLCSNNVGNTDSVFYIDDNGEAAVSVGYFGYPGITTGATITTKLQKQNGSSWDDVIEWTDGATGFMFSNEHILQLYERGTYRVQIEYVVSGSGGADDVITEEYFQTY